MRSGGEAGQALADVVAELAELLVVGARSGQIAAPLAHERPIVERLRVARVEGERSVEVGEGIIVLLSGAGTLTPPGRALVPGDVAGALECLAGEPAATARFTADTATMLALMPVEALEAHLTNHPALVRALLRRLGGRLRVLNRKAA